MGYADASNYLRNLTEQGLLFQPEVTMTERNQPGISFRESMAGGFSLDETEPLAGRQRGKDAATPLTIHVNISIDDLQRFIRYPDHAGSISGRVSFPPLGENIPAKSGRFNLFFPSDAPGLKLMVYELAFEHSGEQYYLAGRKEVHNDRGFDLWKDTTTLYTRLHAGTDESGPVVGAGVLSLSIGDLMALASTIRVTNASSPKEHAQAVADFGRFFMGELWDSYARPALLPIRWWRRLKLWWRRLLQPGSKGPD